MFAGFTPELIAFLGALSMNNNREFFEENRPIYERAVRAPLVALAETLAPVVRAIDPLLDTRPSRVISRIHRDLRFGREKTPYRDYMWIGFRRIGEQSEETCGFYFDISASAVNWGCGYYMAQRVFMQKLRETIVARPNHILEILTEPDFSGRFMLEGEQYKRQYTPPEDLPAPLHAVFQKKNLYAEHHLENMELLFSADLTDQIVADFKLLTPFYTLLRDCMTQTEEM